MDLILIRHGECGTTSTDDALTSRGEWQAQQIGQRLADTPVAALLSSPLLRALGTASIIAQQLGNCPVEVWEELREGLYDAYKGYGRLELLRRFPLAVLPSTVEADSWNYRADTQESMFERCEQIVNRLFEHFEPDDTIVIVSHGGLLTYLLHVLLHIPPHTPIWFQINHGAISRVRLVPEERQLEFPPLYPRMAVEVLSINDTSHFC